MRSRVHAAPFDPGTRVKRPGLYAVEGVVLTVVPDPNAGGWVALVRWWQHRKGSFLFGAFTADEWYKGLVVPGVLDSAERGSGPWTGPPA